MGQFLSLPIAADCKIAGVNLSVDQCAIKFDSLGNVSTFGGLKRGEFQPDPDIAGLGIIIAFLVPSCIIGLLSIIFAILRVHSCFWPWNNTSKEAPNKDKDHISRFHDYTDDFILSAADAQLLLLLAFGVSFQLSSKCNVSIYHFTVAIYMAAIGLAISILAFVIVRDFFKNITWVLRFVVLTISLVFFVKFSRANSLNQGHKSQLPGNTQFDSIVILPMFCFVEDKFNPFPSLSLSEKKHLTHDGLSESALADIVLLCTALFVGACSMLAGCLRKVYPAKRRYSEITLGLKLCVWVISLTVFIWKCTLLMNLRNWVHRSGWFALDDRGVNAENNVRSIGQLAPLFALGIIALTVTNQVTWGWLKRVTWEKLFDHKSDEVSSEDIELNRYNSV